MVHQIHSTYAASISDLKKNPMQTVEGGHGEPVAILNRNQPVFYCLPAKYYEAIIDMIHDYEVDEKASLRIASSNAESSLSKNELLSLLEE